MIERSALRTDDDAADEAVWTSAAAAAARKTGRLAADAPDADIWSRLARSTVSGMTIPPLGTPSRAAGLPTAAAIGVLPGSAPFLRGARATGPWDVRHHVAHADPVAAHASVTAALDGGATSLWLSLGPGAVATGDLAAVLTGVRLDEVPIVLDTDPATPGDVADAARSLVEVAANAGLHPDSCLGFDPIGAMARRALGRDAASSSADVGSTDVLGGLPAVAADAARLGVRAVVVDGSVLHDAGGDDAAEIGYAAAAGTAYLRALTAAGYDVDAACRLIEFRHAVTDEQFPSIAKLRAARLVWHRVCELSGAAPTARAARQHAVTSRAMMTRYDRYVNMLRATVATFAAAVGGADAVTTLPFDAALGDPDEFSERMARNVSALLLGESQVGEVADAAGGAYAVEMLTADLAEAAWAEFGRIEAAGGVLAALADGSIAARTETVRVERARRIAHRTMPITGVSEFPDPGEPTPPRGKSHPDRTGFRWAGYRWAEPFEALRDDPPPESVLLVRVGTEARASARVLFTENLLAAGGIRIEHAAAETGADDDAGDVARAVAESGCRTVVVAGADADYAERLAEVLRAARAGGATSVFLAGRPKLELPEGLIDGTVAIGDDVLEFLRAVRATVGAAS
jgi:methylmalonyl-CoA mutase